MANDTNSKEKKSKYITSYISKTYDQIATLYPKGMRATINSYAKKIGISANAFINTAVKEKMERIDEQERRENEMEGAKPKEKEKRYYIVDDIHNGDSWCDELETADKAEALIRAETEWGRLTLYDKNRRERFELIYADKEDYDNGSVLDHAIVIKKFK